jgi:hypothetical protein
MVTAGAAGLGGQASVTPKSATATADAALPSAAVVLGRHTNAVGGAAALRRHTARRVTGRFEMPAQGIGGPLEVLAAAPDRLLLRIELAGLGQMVRGFDGTVGWSIDPAVGPRVLTGAERDELRYSADFYVDLYEPAAYASMTVVERGPFEGRDCYTVKLVRPSGFEALEMFDVSTGLRAGGRMSSSSAMGTVPSVTTVLSDYKEFGGVLMATRATQRAMGLESVLTIERVEHEPLPAETFAVPPAIAALLK